ncbi:putative integrator complex subunit 3 [Trichinella spiralis]|uniref:putative integrator complex subunit 3 n=1 Tax=Trichinella spiralis TaxID=6334 RepID=UPI0001EFE9BF|nr:putative integrator complex subunit 3 [Trichinella spiralis]
MESTESSKQCSSEEDWEADKLNHLLGELDPKLRVCVKKLSEVKNESSSSCKAMVDLLMAMFQLEKFDQEQATSLAGCLCMLFKMFFAHRLLPDNLSNFEQQQLLQQQHQQQQDCSDDNLNEPLFMIFRNLCLTPEDDPSRKPLLLLLAKMYEKQQRLGFGEIGRQQFGRDVGARFENVRPGRLPPVFPAVAARLQSLSRSVAAVDGNYPPRRRLFRRCHIVRFFGPNERTGAATVSQRYVPVGASGEPRMVDHGADVLLESGQRRRGSDRVDSAYDTEIGISQARRSDDQHLLDAGPAETRAGQSARASAAFVH